MERWYGKTAMVTGASSGIGAAIAEELVKKGLNVIGLARRIIRVQELSEKLEGCPGKLHAIKCDVTKEEDILNAFSWASKHLGGVDVLINNAGVFYEAKLGDGATSEWKRMLDVNILGLSICTREAVTNMKQRNAKEGHIVHINSIAGHYDVGTPGWHMYSATKHAVTALTEGLRKELVSEKLPIRITSVSPGLVDTEIIRLGNVKSVDVEEIYKNIPSLKPKDIADAVIYVIGVPPQVQIHELTIKPTGETHL